MRSDFAIELSPTIETFSVYTLLGIRFWDAHTLQPVQAPLRVQARRPEGSEQPVRGAQTKSNAYAFHNLHGMYRYEAVLDPLTASPPDGPHAFVITVEDPSGVYLPTAFTIELPLPYRGLFAQGNGRAWLFSAPARPLPAGFAAVRADLYDESAGRPAAHAVLTVDVQGRSYQAIADAEGRVLAAVPWPTPDRLRIGSPPAQQNGSVFNQLWPVEVRVAYDDRQLRFPLEHRADASSSLKAIPSLKSVLEAQGPALIYPVAGGPGRSTFSAELSYGRELVLQSAATDTVRLSISRGTP